MDVVLSAIAYWASILKILHFQVLQINFCCCYWVLHNDPFLFGIRVMFSFVALCRDGFFAVQGRFLQWWALWMPREVMRSALSPGHRQSLKPARTPEQGGSSLCRVHILATVCTLCQCRATTTCTDAPPPCSLPQRAHNVAHEGSLAPTPGGLRTPPASLTTRHGNPVPSIIIITFPGNNTLCSL